MPLRSVAGIGEDIQVPLFIGSRDVPIFELEEELSDFNGRCQRAMEHLVTQVPITAFARDSVEGAGHRAGLAGHCLIAIDDTTEGVPWRVVPRRLA